MKKTTKITKSTIEKIVLESVNKILKENNSAEVYKGTITGGLECEFTEIGAVIYKFILDDKYVIEAVASDKYPALCIYNLKSLKVGDVIDIVNYDIEGRPKGIAIVNNKKYKYELISDSGEVAWLESYLYDVKSKIDSKLSLDAGGNLLVDGIRVQINNQSGYVYYPKEGRDKPVDMIKGAFYPPSTGSSQLQGIVYINLVSKLKKGLKDNKKFNEINREILSSGKKEYWEEVKSYLGLK